MIRALLHCLLRLHRLSCWQNDWTGWHWYCQTCHPRKSSLFLTAEPGKDGIPAGYDGRHG